MAKFDLKTFNPEAFSAYRSTLPNPRKNELIKSKALRKSEEIKTLLSTQTGSGYGTIPIFGRIGGAPQNYDGKTNIIPTSPDTYDRSVVAIGRAAAWKEKDFAVDITAGTDFMSEVAKQVNEYFEDVNTDILISVLKGLFAMTGAANLEFVNKHTYDITAKTGDEAKVGTTTCNSAVQQASGDKKAKFSLVLMHSLVSTNLENLNALANLKYTDSNGVQRDLGIATWNGKIVLVDDTMPVEHVEAVEASEGVEAQDAYDKYTTYLLGDGAIDYADLDVEQPNEMVRDALTNGGETTLVTRERICYAPFGISFTKSSMSSLSPTNTELENGANWALVNNGGNGAARKCINHKEIPIARIISKG